MIYSVELIPQTTTNSCWAACMAMILGWKHGISYSQKTIAENPGGPSYETSFNKGLDPKDKYILRANGFALDYPKSYTPDLVRALLRYHGPLWVAT